MINQLYYVAVLVGAAAGFTVLAMNGFGPTPWVPLGGVLVLYLSLISIVFSGQSRYHIPAMPFLMMYAAWWASRMVGRAS